MLTIYASSDVTSEAPTIGAYGVYVFQDSLEHTKMQGTLPQLVSAYQCSYFAVLVSLQIAQQIGDSEVTIYSDSHGVVREFNRPKSDPHWSIKHLWEQANIVISEMQQKNKVVNVKYDFEDNAGNRVAKYLATKAIDHNIPDNSGLSIFLPTMRPTQKGFEEVRNLVEKELDYHHCKQERLSGIHNWHILKTLLTNSSSWAVSLAHPPHILAINASNEPILIRAEASYLYQPEQPAVRVMSLSIWESLMVYADIGHNIYVAHRPFGKGRWITLQELGWGIGSTEVQVTNLTNLEARNIPAPKGWAPTVALFAKKDSNISSIWEPLSDWAEYVSQ